MVSDLHLGFEQEIAEKGVSFRSTALNEMLSEITILIRQTSADRLIILGDLKHSVGSISRQEWDEVPLLLERLSSIVQVDLVPGNHDGNIRHLIPSQVNFVASTGMVLEDVLLVHGHAALPKHSSNVSLIVMGHVHPAYLKRGSVLNGQRVWVYLRTSKKAVFPEGEGGVDVVIVPSFNRYLYATGERIHSLRRHASPVLSRIFATDQNPERCVITTLDGAVVGDSSSLADVLKT